MVVVEKFHVCKICKGRYVLFWTHFILSLRILITYTFTFYIELAVRILSLTHTTPVTRHLHTTLGCLRNVLVVVVDHTHVMLPLEVPVQAVVVVRQFTLAN